MHRTEPYLTTTRDYVDKTNILVIGLCDRKPQQCSAYMQNNDDNYDTKL